MTDNSIDSDSARASWIECERQLYPAAINDANGYQRIVVAVRALANELHDIDSVEQLVERWPEADARLERALTICGVARTMIPREQVLGAGFAIREREICEQCERQARRERINAARERNDEWVVIDESGDLDSGLINPYRAVEMDLTTGLAVMTHVQPDPTDGAPSHVVSIIRLDPSTGELVDLEPGIDNGSEHANKDDLDAHRNALRRRIRDSGAAEDQP